MATQYDGRTSPPISDSRRSQRVELLIEIDGQVAQGQELKVYAHNLSSTGILIDSESPLEIGQKIQMHLPEAGPTEAAVIWGSDSLYGCRLTHPLSRAALSAAKLRNLLPKDGLDESDDTQEADDQARSGAALAHRLRILRENKGLSLAALSRQSGISKPSIWAWETGKTTPRPRSISILANALGVPPAEIWGRSEPSVNGSTFVSSTVNGRSAEEVVAAARQQIAAATGVDPQRVKISIEF